MPAEHRRQEQRNRRVREKAAGAPLASVAARTHRRAAVALVFLTCVAYSPALRAPFQFDDLDSIPGNATIRQLLPLPGPLHPPPGVAVSGRPVVNVSLALNYAANELLGVDQRPDPEGPDKTLGFHLISLLLHLACGALLFGVLRRTLESPRLPGGWATDARPVAGAVTALWLLHPIQTEAVDYLIQRTELLVSLCYLGTLYSAIRAWEATGRASRIRWYAAAIVTCLLGMGSKEVMLTAPLTVFLYDRAFRSATWKETLDAGSGRAWFYPLLVATCALSLSLVFGGARAETVGFHLGVRWYEYLYTQAWAIARYLRLALWPAGLTYDYGQQPITGLRGVPGLILLSALGVTTFAAWKRTPPLGFVGAWFFLTLAPSSSVVPIRTEVAAERRFYLALVPVLLVLALGARLAIRRMDARPPQAPWGAWFVRHRRALFGALCVVLAAVTWQRSRLYADPEALWRDAAEKAPRNPRAWDNLATALLHRDPPRLGEAEGALRKAIAADSTYVQAWPNLAEVVAEQGRLPEARQLLEHVLLIDSNYVRGAERLGVLLVVMGENTAALPYLEHVAAQFPTTEVLDALAAAYMALERPGDAIPRLERAVQLDPSSAFSVGLLSLAYAESGHEREAAEAADFAGRIARSDARALVLAGRTMLLLRRPADAERYLAQAVQASPLDPEAVTRLGIVTAELGRREDAAKLFRRALSLQPDYAPARQSLERLGIAVEPRRPD